MFTLAKLAALCAAFAIGASPSAMAQTGDHPCAAEIRELCPDSSPSERRRCLRERHADLSEQCRARLRGARDRFRGFREACAEDARSLCGDVEPGGGAIRRCLQANSANLSPRCAELIEGR